MNNKASAVRPIFVVEIIVRIAVILLSIGMIYWYLDSGFIGFGSIIGIGFFSSAALCAVFFRFIKALARLMKRSKAGRIIFWVMLSLLILFIIYVITALCLMFSGSAKEPEKDATVIVLGCQVNGTEPSYTLHMRLNTAYDYLNANPQAKAILSGGQGEHEKISEAECMYRFLTEKGINHAADNHDHQDGRRPGKNLLHFFPDSPVQSSAGTDCVAAADKQEQNHILHCKSIYIHPAGYSADAAAAGCNLRTLLPVRT